VTVFNQLKGWGGEAGIGSICKGFKNKYLESKSETHENYMIFNINLSHFEQNKKICVSFVTTTEQTRLRQTWMPRM